MICSRSWGPGVRSWVGNHLLRSGLKPGSRWTNGNIILRNFGGGSQMDSSQNVVCFLFNGLLSLSIPVPFLAVLSDSVCVCACVCARAPVYLTIHTSVQHACVCVCFQKPPERLWGQEVVVFLSVPEQRLPWASHRLPFVLQTPGRDFIPHLEMDWRSHGERHDFLKVLRQSGMGSSGLFLLPLLLSSRRKIHLCWF